MKGRLRSLHQKGTARAQACHSVIACDLEFRTLRLSRIVLWTRYLVRCSNLDLGQWGDFDPIDKDAQVNAHES